MAKYNCGKCTICNREVFKAHYGYYPGQGQRRTRRTSEEVAYDERQKGLLREQKRYFRNLIQPKRRQPKAEEVAA
mgnify:CR=1 FL=1